MKNAKIYIIYIIVVVVLSYAITFGMRIWQHNSRFKALKPLLEKELVIEKWQAADGLTMQDFGTFSMGLPGGDIQMVSLALAPDGKLIEPYILVSTNKGSFKFSQPTSVSFQKQDLEKVKSLKPDDENVQTSKIKDYDSIKSMLDVKMLGYFEFVKLDDAAMKEYINKVNDKVNFLQKAKEVVLFETEDLNGILLQVQGVITPKEGAEGSGKPFANAEITLWSKTGDITQKFFVNGKPGEIDSSIELIKRVVPSVNYAGREVQTLDKQLPLCIETIKGLEWFKYIQLKPANPEGVAVPAGSLEEVESSKQ